MFHVHYRRPKLKAPKDPSEENPEQAAQTKEVDKELAEKLQILEKLGITMDDLEKLFKK